MPQSRSQSKSRNHHVPLEEDILKTGSLKARSNKRKARPETQDDGYIDSKSSRKILRIGQDLVDEDQKENLVAISNPAFTFESRPSEANTFQNEKTEYEDDDEAWGDEDENFEEAVGPDPRVVNSRLTGLYERK